MPIDALFTLPAQAETEWGLRRVCQLALLRDRMAAAGAAGARAATPFSAGWLEALSVADLLRHATPFFWLNVVRCHEACTRAGAELAVALRYLLMTGFDAFFPLAADDFSCRLPAADDPIIVLPGLGIRLTGTGGPAWLCRVGPRVIRVEDEGGQATTLLLDDVPAGARLAWLPVGRADSARLLLNYDPALGPGAWTADVPADPSDPAGQAAMIASALELIREVDPRLVEQITTGITWYVPLVSSDPAVHRSRTVADLRGVVFLSPCRERETLAEAIVHEYYHGVLNVRMEAETLLSEGDERRFYSPWREDPRPLAGLLHALYVFSGVAEFLLRAEGTPGLAQQCPALRERRRCLVARLRLGHAQALVERFTPPGRRLLEELAAVIDRHEADLGLSRDGFPDALVPHLRKWRAANPHLSAGVRWPFAPARDGRPGLESPPWEND